MKLAKLKKNIQKGYFLKSNYILITGNIKVQSVKSVLLCFDCVSEKNCFANSIIL